MFIIISKQVETYKQLAGDGMGIAGCSPDCTLAWLLSPCPAAADVPISLGSGGGVLWCLLVMLPPPQQDRDQWYLQGQSILPSLARLPTREGQSLAPLPFTPTLLPAYLLPHHSAEWWQFSLSPSCILPSTSSVSHTGPLQTTMGRQRHGDGWDFTRPSLFNVSRFFWKPGWSPKFVGVSVSSVCGPDLGFDVSTGEVVLKMIQTEVRMWK